MSKRQIEVFTGGCPACDEAVQLVKGLACPECEVFVYDLSAGCETNECGDKASRYGVTRVPSVVVDGQLASCCEGGVQAEGLRQLGVGS